ncbi:MAG TPA: RNA-guided endonuclease TnpB family protein [Streptosporangiaceae bacterium]|nr:RNA-guided endonuclease TnpB family protein [Streptosporangiaceae bacterium]
MRTAYKCRAYPDQEQASVLNRTFGCVRVVWNRTLTWRQQRYRADKTATTFAQASAYLTAMKATEELTWLNEVSSVPLQQAIRHQQAAYTAFFAKRARCPRFKSRNGRQSAAYTRSAFRWRDGRLYLAKMDTPLAFTWSWPAIDPASVDPTTVTVSRDPCGRWYVAFAVDIPAPDPLPTAGRAVGVDLGITDFAVTSDGQRISNPRHLERRARNLARYQRRTARCQPGSANRVKARAKAARAHRKVRAARTDFLHKAPTGLVRDHDVIVVEDLAVQNMVRNRTLAKAISDCGWGTFWAMLAYKAARYGRHLIVIDRWFPSSKTCSACGHLLAALSLDTRHWTCPSCGTRHDRDINAAKNTLAAGRAVAGDNLPGHACGADVRHPGSSRVQSAVKQEPGPRGPESLPFKTGSSQVSPSRLSSSGGAPGTMRRRSSSIRAITVVW